MHYEVKSKISSALVQLTVHFFHETKRTATKFEGLEKKRRIIRTIWAGTGLGSAGPYAISVFGAPRNCDLLGRLSEKRERMPL